VTNWHIITCEYPPQIGGVSDYTRLLAAHLRQAGDPVQVWAPTFDAPKEPGLHRVLGNFDASYLREIEGLFDTFPQPRTFLLQWVPHGYGKRGMNLGFVRWITSRVRRGDQLYLMVHEPYLEPTRRSLKLRLVSMTQRKMIRLLLASASRVFVSIPAWERYLRRYGPANLDYEWLSIPATIADSRDEQGIAAVKSRFTGSRLIGHLGTYSAELRQVLQPTLIKTLRDVPEASVLLLGNHSDEFAADFRAQHIELRSRTHGAGLLADSDLANHISACDLMLQPYPDGVSSRRTSLMNVISRGVSVVSNLGHLSEPLWSETQAVVLSPSCDSSELASRCAQLLRDESARSELGQAALDLYRSRFDWPQIIAAMRAANPTS
jgi:glycosyltransferase involved in cell wall biosynthesis